MTACHWPRTPSFLRDFAGVGRQRQPRRAPCRVDLIMPRATLCILCVLPLSAWSLCVAPGSRQWAISQAIAAGEDVVDTNQLLAAGEDMAAATCTGESCKPLRDALAVQSKARLSARARSYVAHARLTSVKVLLSMMDDSDEPEAMQGVVRLVKGTTLRAQLTQLTQHLAHLSDAAATRGGDPSLDLNLALAECDSTLDAVDESVAAVRAALAMVQEEAARQVTDDARLPVAVRELEALAATEGAAGVTLQATSPAPKVKWAATAATTPTGGAAVPPVPATVAAVARASRLPDTPDWYLKFRQKG